MSTGAILQRVQEHLQNNLSLVDDQCAIREDGKPLSSSGQSFVAISETGVTREGKTYLRETHHIEISIWRRATDVPADVTGHLLYGSDPWQAAMMAIEEVERAVIRSLHGNHVDIPKWLNETYNLGSSPQGDKFLMPLFYEGRKATETITGKSNSQLVWIGRRLRFSGLSRIQAMDVLQ